MYDFRVDFFLKYNKSFCLKAQSIKLENTDNKKNPPSMMGLKIRHLMQFFDFLFGFGFASGHWVGGQGTIDLNAITVI